MNIYKAFDNAVKFITEAAARIFSPTDDSYPATGVQPFDGEPYDQSHGKDW